MMRTVSSLDHPTESIVMRPDREGRPARARLRTVAPRGVRWVLEIDAMPVTLGRAPDDGTPALVHGTVSRRHARVVWDADRRAHVVEDLGSRHGTQVDGAAPGVLADGAILRLGGVFLVYERAVERPDAHEVSLDALPGDSSAMARLRADVVRAAADPSPVLIVGATGTGKEWVAGELHRLSGRRGPLLPVNCAALAPQLVESQLFGHVRGAFTGATDASDGLFRAAHGGTLLLDEIGELPLDLQPKLLRVLQDGLVQPVGGTRAVPVDVRVLGATNRDIPAMIDAGRFRRDLHARLAKWEIDVPSLTERRADLPMWIDRLWRAWCRARDFGEDKCPLPEPTTAATAALFAHPWPDNLRGIDRLVHDLASRAARGAPATIDVDDLPGWLREEAGADAILPASAPAAGKPPVPTREEFEAAWRELGGNVRALARKFERDRRQIYRWAEAYGLRGAHDSD